MVGVASLQLAGSFPGAAAAGDAARASASEPAPTMSVDLAMVLVMTFLLVTSSFDGCFGPTS
jgi:heme/copper-type cytochrome/quinol oxidase subunit 3